MSAKEAGFGGKFRRFNDSSAVSSDSTCFFGRLKLINFIGASCTDFLVSSTHREDESFLFFKSFLPYVCVTYAFILVR